MWPSALPSSLSRNRAVKSKCLKLEMDSPNWLGGLMVDVFCTQIVGVQKMR